MIPLWKKIGEIYELSYACVIFTHAARVKPQEAELHNLQFVDILPFSTFVAESWLVFLKPLTFSHPHLLD